MPRRKALIAPGALKIIRTMAATGVREGAIARKLGLSPATFSKLKHSDPRVEAAFESGRDQLEEELLHNLRNPVIDTASGLSVEQSKALMNRLSTNAMYLTKALFGYRDGGEPPTTGPKLAVQINLPAPAPDLATYTARVISEQGEQEGTRLTLTAGEPLPGRKHGA